MSRIEKFDAEKKKAYLELLRNGGRRMASARAVGVNPRTVENHIKKDKKFAAELSRAEIEANQQVEDALYQAALSGNVTAIQVWLYNRDPDNWQDKRNNELKRLEEVIRQLEERLDHAGHPKQGSEPHPASGSG